MTALIYLPELCRSFISLWTLLLCVICVFCVILSGTQKNYRFSLLALLPFFCSYFLWQSLFDLHLSVETGNATAVSRMIGELGWLFCVGVLCVLTAAAILILVSVIRYGKLRVNPSAVKYFLDRMPCGVCLWRDDGRVLFSNICMNRLCAAVTGRALQTGDQLFEAAASGILSAEGRLWRFSRRDIVLDGERLHELIASDITAEYAKTEALERDKARLSELNRELREYTLGIDEAVRRREILQAKINIHDEMNRLMLSTMAANAGDAATLDGIFSLWEQNALLLCMEAHDPSGDKAAERVEKLAELLKIKLVWRGEIPLSLSEKQRGLFFSAAQEAIANAAKHAQAKTMEISFDESDTFIDCVFTNDGIMSTEEIRFEGGLANLALAAKREGASVSADCAGAFSLTLRFMKSDPGRPLRPDFEG